jgi:hypothetical protein
MRLSSNVSKIFFAKSCTATLGMLTRFSLIDVSVATRFATFSAA